MVYTHLASRKSILECKTYTRDLAACREQLAKSTKELGLANDRLSTAMKQLSVAEARIVKYGIDSTHTDNQLSTHLMVELMLDRLGVHIRHKARCDQRTRVHDCLQCKGRRIDTLPSEFPGLQVDVVVTTTLRAGSYVTHTLQTLSIFSHPVLYVAISNAVKYIDHAILTESAWFARDRTAIGVRVKYANGTSANIQRLCCLPRGTNQDWVWGVEDIEETLGTSKLGQVSKKIASSYTRMY